MANIIQSFPKGGGSGHTILDGDGTALAQEKNLKISGLSVTDNPVDESTDLAPAGLNEDSLNDVCNGSIGTNFITPSFNYSTNEQIVGKWIDGKPLYQKTVRFTSLTAGQQHYSHGISNVEYINVVINASLVKFAGATWTIFGWNCNLSNNNYSVNIMDITPTVADVFIGSAIVNDATEMLITFQYTKTTDT